MPNTFGLAGKVAEATGNTEASLDGLDGVFLRLELEHREAAALIERIKTTEDLEEQEDVWIELSAALLSHERAELQEVYGAFEIHPGLAVLTHEHEAQAERLEGLVADLDALPLDSSEWATVFELLETAVKRHIHQEEAEFFPKALAIIGKEQAERLEAPYGTAKDFFAQSIRSV